MSLAGSRIKSQLHPWLRIRIEYLEAIVDHFGGVFIYLSGYRTRVEQQRLFDRTIRQLHGRPAAAPGCSQHNHFGPNGQTMAVDIGITGPARYGEMAFGGFNEQIDVWARQMGLVTVPRDTGHFQVFPGSEFRKWAVSSGSCLPIPAISARDPSIAYLNCLKTAVTVSQERFCFNRFILSKPILARFRTL